MSKQFLRLEKSYTLAFSLPSYWPLWFRADGQRQSQSNQIFINLSKKLVIITVQDGSYTGVCIA